MGIETLGPRKNLFRVGAWLRCPPPSRGQSVRSVQKGLIVGLRTYDVPLPAPYSGSMFERYYNLSNNSPKVGGKLIKQANAHTFAHGRVASWHPVGPLVVPYSATLTNWMPISTSQYNATYARWLGKVRGGSASMGVTLASWGQSRSMIIDRFSKLTRFVRHRERVVRQKPWLNRRRQLASDFLEGEFGWLPLVSDIHAALTTVCANAIPPQWVRASARFSDSWVDEVYYSGKIANRRVFTGNSRCTIGCKAEIDNPNLWLANRLGVINPVTVAWDLVPWSFVVNMFLNVNQVVGAITDTVGLTLTQSNVTRSSNVLVEDAAFVQSDFTSGGIEYRKGMVSTSSVVIKSRNRTLGIPMPSLSLRVPGVDWELAAIASALFYQRVSRL